MSIPQKVSAITPGELIESVIVKGDLSKLDPAERSRYYVEVCKSVGLNPLTRPFEYITLNGKLTLYAKRDCADQLRKINGISIRIISQDESNGMLTIHVGAKDQAGREDEDLGVVALPEKGEARANAILKAVTKAKRRVTLSISGLGFLDETEVEDIQNVKPKPGAALAVAAPDDYTPPPGSIDKTQVEELRVDLANKGASERAFLAHIGIGRLEDIPTDMFEGCKSSIAGFKRKG